MSKWDLDVWSVRFFFWSSKCEIECGMCRGRDLDVLSVRLWCDVSHNERHLSETVWEISRVSDLDVLSVRSWCLRCEIEIEILMTERSWCLECDIVLSRVWDTVWDRVWDLDVESVRSCVRSWVWEQRDFDDKEILMSTVWDLVENIK